MRNTLERCSCGSGKPATALYDGHNIFMCYACDDCRAERISYFRPDIFTAYDCDEPIDED